MTTLQLDTELELGNRVEHYLRNREGLTKLQKDYLVHGIGNKVFLVTYDDAISQGLIGLAYRNGNKIKSMLIRLEDISLMDAEIEGHGVIVPDEEEVVSVNDLSPTDALSLFYLYDAQLPRSVA